MALSLNSIKFDKKVILGFSVSALILGFIAVKYDLGASIEKMQQFSIADLLVIVALSTINLLLSCHRLHCVFKSFRIHLGRLVVAYANIQSIIAGMLFFHLVGQTLTRFTILKKHGVSGSEALITTVYERITAVLVLVILALLGVGYLFKGATVEMFGGEEQLMLVLLVALVVIFLSYRMVYGRIIRRLATSFSYKQAGKNFLKDTSVSLLVQLSMLAVYLYITVALSRDIDLDVIIASSLIVMFAGSLPLSFSGWGIRELGAIYAYSHIGILPEEAIAISVTVGLSGIVSMLLLSMALSMFTREVESSNCGNTEQDGIQDGRLDYFRALSWFIPLIAVTLVAIQIRVPTATGELNVNLADPFAIAGGVLFLLTYVTSNRHLIIWRFRYVGIFLTMMSVSIVLAFFTGLINVGFNDWGFLNRFIGWFVLLSYLATGALVVLSSGNLGVRMLGKTYILVLCVIIVAELLMTMLAKFGVPVFSFNDNVSQLSGLSQNPNAFAFQILMGLCLLFAGGSWSPHGSRKRAVGNYFVIAGSILLIGLWYAKSRSAYGAVLILLVLSILLRFVPLRKILPVLGGAILGIGVIWSTNHLLIDMVELSMVKETSINAMPTLVRERSDASHVASMLNGIELFIERPIFGGGLGAFLVQQLSDTGIYLLIHSTPIWLLAESGLIGFLAFFASFLYLLVQNYQRRFEVQSRIAILVLLTFAVESVVHDMLYQRTFWIIFGFALACASVRRGGGEKSFR